MAHATELRAPRGRHAPPPEVRLPLQRQRLLRAAAEEFAERGYAAASAAAIARRAGMSKATFYSHFSNKLACILALVDRANEGVAEAMAKAARSACRSDAAARLRAGIHAYLIAIAEHPEFARALLVEIVGAGPTAMAKRDQGLQLFAAILDAENAAAARRGLSPRFASPYDSYAIVGGITELVSRHVRLGEPENLLELGPVIDRLIGGLLVHGT